MLIDVERVEADEALAVYLVRVREGRGATEHRVTVKSADLTRLGRPAEAGEAFVRRCFEFLLEREPKESIMGSFDVSVIGRYFPEFERVIQRP